MLDLTDKPCYACQYWYDWSAYCLEHMRPAPQDSTCEKWILDPMLTSFLETMPKQVVVNYAVRMGIYEERAEDLRGDPEPGDKEDLEHV